MKLFYHKTIQIYILKEKSVTDLVNGGSELEAVVEEADASEHVESKACTRHGHDQPAHIAQMSNRLGTH